MAGWIGVDFDRTLARYDGWKGDFEFGEPIQLMVERVKRWLTEGKDVRIFTSRVSAFQNLDGTPGDVEPIRIAIQDWCEKHIGKRLPVTNVKDYGCDEIWDDIAIQIIRNTGIRADGKD